VKKSEKIMKKNNKPKFDLKTLSLWKKVSTKGKLEWLESALRFGKLRKF
jgi:hypothetical protein